jgi:hypothetical protein
MDRILLVGETAFQHPVPQIGGALEERLSGLEPPVESGAVLHIIESEA